MPTNQQNLKQIKFLDRLHKWLLGIVAPRQLKVRSCGYENLVIHSTSYKK